MISETLGLPFLMLSTGVTITRVDPVLSSSKPYLPQQNTLHSIPEDGYRTGVFVSLWFWRVMCLNLDGLPVVNKIKQDEFVTIPVIHVTLCIVIQLFKPLMKGTWFNLKKQFIIIYMYNIYHIYNVYMFVIIKFKVKLSLNFHSIQFWKIDNWEPR